MGPNDVYVFKNTDGWKIIKSATAPSGKMPNGDSLNAGDIWVNTTTKSLEVYDGSAFGREGETAAGVYKYQFDAAAYFTATIADGAGVTFNATSDGTANFTFADPVILNATAGCHLQLGATATAALTIGGGASATKLTTATADKNFGGFYTQSTAVSGDSRGLYWKHHLDGIIAATGFGDCGRFFTSVSGTGYSYASGTHATMQIEVGGTVTGSGSGLRATLSAAAASRTLAGALSSLHVCSDIADGNTMPTVHGFMRFTDDGAVRMSNLAVIPVPANGTLLAAHITQAMTHSIRIIGEDGTPYYIMCTNDATDRS